MRTSFYILLGLLCFSCTNKDKVIVQVANPSDFDRNGELVELAINDINNRLPLNDKQTYLVINEKGDTLPSQITSDKKLIFESQLKSKEQQTFTIIRGIDHNTETVVWTAHHPERYGDLAWENDRVGFRIYGKELKEIQAPTSGIDLWYKRTDKIVLDEWYRKELAKEASYHVDHGEGCDPYAVGQTLGAGNMAIFSDSTLILNQNFESYQILDNGPLRTTFEVSYLNIDVNGNSITEKKIVSLDKGSQLTKIVQYFDTNIPLDVVVGFPKRASGDSIFYQKNTNYLVYEEPYDSINGQIFLGAIIPEGIKNVFVNKQTKINQTDKTIDNMPNVVALATYKPDSRLVYYTGFGWSKFGFDKAGSFVEYVKRYAESIQQPLQITYK